LTNAPNYSARQLKRAGSHLAVQFHPECPLLFSVWRGDRLKLATCFAGRIYRKSIYDLFFAKGVPDEWPILFKKFSQHRFCRQYVTSVKRIWGAH
jgi:hypothetical protein